MRKPSQRPEALCYADVDALGAAVLRGAGIGTAGELRYVDRGVPADRIPPPAAVDSRRDAITDLLARAAIVALFTLLSVNLFADFMQTGRVTGLLLLAGESLVVVLTVVRRRARLVDRSAAAAIVTTLSLVGPPLLRASQGAPIAADAVTAIVSAVGLVLVVVGKVALGRSFGIAPANRGVVVRGPYTLVRHPIYTGYLITHVAFFLANPTPWNATIILIGDTALVIRALMEERVLSQDVAYQGYCRRVGWHLVPGVF
jgi:protein-S-isoprenylcysteine O-methyltransferase Ste14